jgi:hypothetical protein
MSPDDGAVTIPVWVIVSVVVPVTIGALELMRRMGLRELSRWENRVSSVEEQIGDLEAKIQGDHDDVSGQVSDLKEEIRALRREMGR